MDAITISNREITLMAFNRLHKDNRKDSTLKFARCMLHGTSISPGISDIDWEIDRAIQQCEGVPRTRCRHTAYFHFNRNTEVAKEVYDKIAKELYGQETHEGDLKAASVIYSDMYGERSPAVYR